ncbi:hypothetical protein [Parabacteroides sp. PFB2-10]|uniref:hypothetical protein n=1 Tax=Parabacteroides sp. PFB2-10 TaxID=1742405 RepID=UPI002476748A|nr:hypothetical protein [Parabacteroides sp. PFB2-10]
MKKILTYTFTFLMAILVFYGGAGVNIISFCCNDCRDAGVEVLTSEKCCEIHGHSHDEVPVFEAGTNAISHSNEMCCDLERVYFDWDFEQVAKQNLDPIVIDLFVIDGSLLSTTLFPIASKMEAVLPNGPPLPPETYLSLLTTLLI